MLLSLFSFLWCSGRTGWFFVPHYGWQYDPKYSKEWDAYYRQMFGKGELKAYDNTERHQLYSGNDASAPYPPTCSMPPSPGPLPPLDVSAHDPVADMKRQYSEAYNEYVVSTSPAGALPAGRRWVSREEDSEAGIEDGDEAHLRLDLLSGLPYPDPDGDAQDDALEAEDEGDDDDDLPKSEDLEVHASELIERLNVHLPIRDGTLEAEVSASGEPREAASKRMTGRLPMGGQGCEGPRAYSDAQVPDAGQRSRYGDGQGAGHCWEPPHLPYSHPWRHLDRHPSYPHQQPPLHHFPPPPHQSPPHYQQYSPPYWHGGCLHCQMAAFYDQYYLWCAQYSAWQKEFGDWQKMHFQ